MSSMLSKGIGAALLCCGLAVPAFAQTQLTISASPSSPQVGQNVGLDVMISNVQDLYGYQFSLSFDPALLQALGGSEGSFLSAGGNTFFDVGMIDNSAGTLSFSFNTLLSDVPGVSGSGTLVHLNFAALATGTSALNFSDVIFLNSQSADITLTAQSGSLTVVSNVPEPESLALLMAGLGVVAWRRRSVAAATTAAA